MSIWVFRWKFNVRRPADTYEQYTPGQETAAFLLCFENNAGNFELNVKATAASNLSSPIGGERSTKQPFLRSNQTYGNCTFVQGSVFHHTYVLIFLFVRNPQRHGGSHT